MPSDDDYEELRKFVRPRRQVPREDDKATTPGRGDTRISVVEWLSGVARTAFRRFKPG